ncbi:MAG: hypothetical protein MJ178_05790 [Treponemataceae bacterium]|nr:hypothetical protein [Treponemataceae bacterium]
MSSNKSHGFGTTVLVILIVALILGSCGAVVYLTGLVPSFNATVDLYLNRTGVIAASPEPVTAQTAPVSTPVSEPAPAPVVTPVEPAESVTEEPVSLIDQYLTPKDNAARLILAGFKNWAGDTRLTLPAISFFYPRNTDGTWSLPVDDYEPRLIPFSPAEQGMYTIGLAQEKGSMIEALAYVAVFEESGELLAVSVDYHADRPFVSLHLRDDRIYYIAQGWFTDENPIPEQTVLRVQEAL